MNRPLFLFAAVWFSQAGAGELPSVLAHPPFASFYSCAEHGAGQMPYLGDALGTDCFVQRLVEIEGRTWIRAYSGEGHNNEDWYGWNVAVLSPCNCTVAKIHDNPIINKPGVLGKPPATYVLLKRDDGIHFTVAHVQAVSVQQGQKLKYGQPFAKVGNNGYSRQPHIHMGAWKDETPLQIRFDQNFVRAPQNQSMSSRGHR